MRAVRHTDNGIEVVDLPSPDAADGRVRVHVRGAGICGSDLHMLGWGPMPVTLGHEISGHLDDGTPVAVWPLVPCGRCDRCDPTAFDGLLPQGGLPLGQAVELWWRKRRFRCGEDRCRGRSFTQTATAVRPRGRLTERLRDKLASAIAGSNRSVADVAAEYGVSWPTAHKALVAAAAGIGQRQDRVPGKHAPRHPAELCHARL